MPVQIKKIPEGISVSELIDLIPKDLISDLAEELMVDKWVRKLKADYLFKLLLFSILSNERLSLRVMEDNFEDPIFRLFAPAIAADKITWVGIRDRLMKVNSTFFQRLYEAVYKKAKELYSTSELDKYHIRRYDSTMIATFSHLLEGMKVGNTKKGKTQIKLTTEFTDDFLIRMEFFKDQAHLGEEVALKEVIQNVPKEDNSIRVFDKGLKSRGTFEEFDQDGVLFVGRLCENARYDILRPHSLDDGFQDNTEISFVEDNVVQLYKSGKHKPFEKEFRVIKYYTKSEGKMLLFITNVWDIQASEIANVYKQRWDIEVLFRFMKQEMNLTHFVCNDINAIKVMLYCTMIASMLVLIFKRKNSIKSYKRAKIRFFKELLYTILLEALDDPNETIRIKNILKQYVKKE